MRKIKSNLFVSLDGVADADAQWQFAYFDEELFQGISRAWESSDTAVMGRRSFEGYAALRAEHPDSAMVAFLEGVRRYVASTTFTATDWPGTTVLNGHVYEHLADLKAQPDADLLVAGSPTLVRGLLGRHLLDELNMTVLPVVVGTGDRLFPESSTAQDLEPLALELTSCTTLQSGVLQLQYTLSASAGPTT